MDKYSAVTKVLTIFEKIADVNYDALRKLRHTHK